MSEDAQTKAEAADPSQAGDLVVKAGYDEHRGFWAKLFSRGRPAAYAALGLTIVLGVYLASPVPGGLVTALFASLLLGLLAGLDLTGSQNRRMEREIGRYRSEIDRISAERRHLQDKFISSLQSSKKRVGK